jgi:hypothetical protein
MKTKQNLLAFLIHAGALCLVPLVHSATYYWDTDGATAGAGGASPAGNWATAGSTWSTDPDGIAAVSALTITVRNAYQTWALTNAISSAPGQDKDNDGVKNAVEFVLGGTVSANDLGKLPTVSTTATDMIFTFQRKRSSIDGITGLTIEVGTTLSSWPTIYTVGTTTGTSTAGVVVTENTPSGFDTITLTVSKGSDPKKFAQLKADVTE